MQVTFSYFAQVRQAAGVETEKLALAESGKRHGEAFRTLVLDEFGVVRPSMLVLVNGVPAQRGGQRPLADGDEVTLLSAVAGG